MSAPSERTPLACLYHWERTALPPTMKIRRNIIEKHYEPKVSGWFAARQAVIWEG